ncbi:hypothetical protein D4764_04G0015130 [Takifugu flavidus]|uniref:Alkylated DNA repair protein AlkB homologue 8 N-terminal domain-containing protein n=1 Tax=Takifugu flavidus TaxID=433684 RepID=A0A5C6N6A4_9TELE|nr:hypothetical protein D4764_04G0015130 [Takifugu flavidus]
MEPLITSYRIRSGINCCWSDPSLLTLTARDRKPLSWRHRKAPETQLSHNPPGGPLLRTFYDSVEGSAIFYGIVCWSSSIMDRDRKRINRLVRRASSVLGCPLDSVEVDTLTALGSSFSERLLHPRCVKERYRRSFLPAAVRLHNKHNGR